MKNLDGNVKHKAKETSLCCWLLCTALCCPPNSHAEALTLNVMVFGDEAFGR